MNKPGMEGPEKQKADGYEVRSGPRTTGDGIAAFEDFSGKLPRRCAVLFLTAAVSPQRGSCR